MYLSVLLIDVGDNPDRPRPGRTWLRNVYHVHQRLCMAFPSEVRKSSDPEFLQPYRPADFCDKQAHVQRAQAAGFLFRIDPQTHGCVAILVQSASKPDWDYAFGLKPGVIDSRTHRPIGNAGYLLAAPPSEPRPIEFKLEEGRRLGFRLLANPVRKASQRSVNANGELLGERWVGKNVPVPATDEHLREWLERRAEPRWAAPKNSEQRQAAPGFRLVEIRSIQPGYVYFNKSRESGKGQQLRSARYDGVLEVTNPTHFRGTLARGIGHAKAFGFGLLSLAPLENQP